MFCMDEFGRIGARDREGVRSSVRQAEETVEGRKARAPKINFRLLSDDFCSSTSTGLPYSWSIILHILMILGVFSTAQTELWKNQLFVRHCLANIWRLGEPSAGVMVALRETGHHRHSLQAD